METLGELLRYLIRHVPAGIEELRDMEAIVTKNFGPSPEEKAAADLKQEAARTAPPAAAAAAPSPAAAAAAPPAEQPGFTGNMTVKQAEPAAAAPVPGWTADQLQALADQARAYEQSEGTAAAGQPAG